MAWTTPSTWTAGAVLTAAQLNQQLRDNLNAAFPLGAPDVAWTSYVPTLTNVTLGNGTLTGKYTRVGRTIHYRIKLVWGSTTSASGSQIFGLPVAAHADYVLEHIMGIISVLDAGTAVFEGHARWVTSTTVGANRIGGSGAGSSSMNATAPMTWTTNDLITISGTYEAAS